MLILDQISILWSQETSLRLNWVRKQESSGRISEDEQDHTQMRIYV